MRLKSSSLERIILSILFILGSGMLYYKLILADQIEQITKLDKDIAAVNQNISTKDIELKTIGSMEEEIAKKNIDLKFFKMKILPYSEIPQKLILLQDSIKLNHLKLEKIELKEPVEKTVKYKEEIKYGEISIYLEVFGQYDDLKTFLEQMNGSINSFIIDKIEITPKEENIQAKIDLYTYTLLKNPEEEDNISNYNFMEYKHEYQNPFKSIDSTKYEVSNMNTELFEEQPSDLNIQDFKIGIKDAYAAGDNFYITGPGDLGDYTTVQIKSMKPVNFYLTVNHKGYRYRVEAQNQEAKSYEKEISLDHCRIVIDSTVMNIKNNQTLKTGIYIENNIGNIFDVELKGNYLDRIYIYSSNGTQIHPGEMKDNIYVKVS